MRVLELKVNGSLLLDLTNKIDWGIVKNTPSIVITSNAHTHGDRYYTQSEVTARINSLSVAIDGLTAKVNAL